MSRLAQIYLGGWAFVFAMLLSAIAGASGRNEYSTPEVTSAFENIALVPDRFIIGTIATWIAYSLPFVPFWWAARKRSAATHESTPPT